MFLATARSSTRTEAERIILTIPSGKHDVEIALTYHQAMHLAQHLRREANEAFERITAPPSAEVVAFKRRVHAR